VAVASTGPYANHLHLAPDRQPCQYPTTQFLLQAGCPSCHPTNSFKVLKELREGTSKIICLKMLLKRSQGRVIGNFDRISFQTEDAA